MKASNDVQRRLLLLGVALATLLLIAPRPRAVVDRSFQPVVLTGHDVAELVGEPVNQLFVYAYHAGQWVQIPSQIDEKVTNDQGQRIYTAEGDGVLDADEELVFMVKDLGERAPRSAWVEGAADDLRYEIIVDAGGGTLRWGYLYHGPDLRRTFTQDYARFIGEAERIVTERYAVSFLPDAFGLGELTLNHSGVDILDRTKIRVRVRFPIGSLTFTEENLPISRPSVAPVKDGPVRLVLGERGGFAYGTMFQTQNEVDLRDALPPLSSLDYLRFTTDFNLQAVTTSTAYLDATLSQPVTIDGQPDDVPDWPVPTWRQVSHPTGTLIEISDVSDLGGTQRNYYRDNVEPAEGDTGDGHSYGEFGFEVDEPKPVFRFTSTWIVLPPTQEPVGAAYAQLVETPLPVEIMLQTGEAFSSQIYLPLVRR